MPRIQTDFSDIEELTGAEERIFEQVAGCLAARRRLAAWRTVSGWLTLVLVGGVIKLDGYHWLLAIAGGLIGRWCVRQLFWALLRPWHERLGRLVLTYRENPACASLVRKLNRGTEAYVRGEWSGTIQTFYAMRVQLLDSLTESNHLLVHQFLGESEPLSAPWLGRRQPADSV